MYLELVYLLIYDNSICATVKECLVLPAYKWYLHWNKSWLFAENLGLLPASEINTAFFSAEFSILFDIVFLQHSWCQEHTLLAIWATGIAHWGAHESHALICRWEGAPSGFFLETPPKSSEGVPAQQWRTHQSLGGTGT